jgi:hypothetical protein
MSSINVDIKPTGTESAYIEAPFDKGKDALEKVGYKIISLRDNALLRIQQGKDSFVSRNGNWTKEGFLYVPEKGVFLVRNSPIMDNAKQATDYHRKGNEFYLTQEQVDESLKDSVKTDGKSIPTDRFKDDALTVFAFADVAEQYGNLLKEAGITEMPIRLVGMEKKPFVRQNWFRNLGDGSDLDGSDGRDLDDGNRVRGVRYAEGVAQKNIEIYTIDQITKALTDIGHSGAEKGLVNKLRQ